MSSALNKLLNRSIRVSPEEVGAIGRRAYSSDTINDYYESRAANEVAKKSHREKIVQFFDGTVERVGSANTCFSFPGKHWKMENLLTEAGSRKKPWRFVAVERQLGILEYGMRYMPRKQTAANYVPYENMTVAMTDRATIANCSALHLMESIKTDDQASKVFGKWACFWWDMQGPLSLELAHMISRLPYCLSKNCERYPFALTIMIGRDGVKSGDNDSLEYRAELVASQMTTRDLSVKINCLEKYESANGANMGLVLGMMTR